MFMEKTVLAAEIENSARKAVRTVFEARRKHHYSSLLRDTQSIILPESRRAGPKTGN